MLGFLMLYGKWIALAMLIGGIVLYVRGAEATRVENKSLKKEIALVSFDLEASQVQIRNLNDRIKANNERWLAAVEAERERVEAAKQIAETVRTERDQIAADLRIAHQKWQEEVRNDETLADFVAHAVPDAVWDRLCNAAGDCR